jgi:hypothetical protein
VVPHSISCCALLARGVAAVAAAVGATRVIELGAGHAQLGWRVADALSLARPPHTCLVVSTDAALVPLREGMRALGPRAGAGWRVAHADLTAAFRGAPDLVLGPVAADDVDDTPALAADVGGARVLVAAYALDSLPCDVVRVRRGGGAAGAAACRAERALVRPDAGAARDVRVQAWEAVEADATLAALTARLCADECAETWRYALVPTAFAAFVRALAADARRGGALAGDDAAVARPQAPVLLVVCDKTLFAGDDALFVDAVGGAVHVRVPHWDVHGAGSDGAGSDGACVSAGVDVGALEAVWADAFALGALPCSPVLAAQGGSSEQGAAGDAAAGAGTWRRVHASVGAAAAHWAPRTGAFHVSVFSSHPLLVPGDAREEAWDTPRGWTVAPATSAVGAALRALAAAWSPLGVEDAELLLDARARGAWPWAPPLAPDHEVRRLALWAELVAWDWGFLWTRPRVLAWDLARAHRACAPPHEGGDRDAVGAARHWLRRVGESRRESERAKRRRGDARPPSLAACARAADEWARGARSGTDAVARMAHAFYTRTAMGAGDEWVWLARWLVAAGAADALARWRVDSEHASLPPPSLPRL